MAATLMRVMADAAGWGDSLWVDSCGVSDEEEGNPMDRRAVVKTDAGNVAALTERYAEYREMVTVEEASAGAPVAPGQPEKAGMSDWGIIGIAAAAAVVLIIVITAVGNKKRAQKERQEPGA